MRTRQKRILLAMGWYDYRLHRGIEQYAQDHGWHLCSDVTREKIIPWGWEGDGILAWLGAGDDLAEFVTHAKRPTVDFSYRRPQLPFPRVLVDHAACAQLVVEHFLKRGLKNFIFYSDVDNWAYEENGRGFVKALSDAGHACTWLRWHQSPTFTPGHLQWKYKRNWLVTQLKQAPKPLAVFAATDDRALEVLEACERAGLNVPEQVSLVGMDNSLLAVDAMHTPVSSVDTNLGMVGYRGAELLDQLMHGKPSPREPIRIVPAGLIVRKSSDLLAVNHAGVALALRFIWARCHEPIQVGDIAKAAGLSTRGLHQAFTTHIGRSPGSELHRARFERAKNLLVTSAKKMDIIAEMCGYESANSFWVAFKQAAGMSPSKYRKKFVQH
jgi:LacI family transcriptional regulator